MNIFTNRKEKALTRAVCCMLGTVVAGSMMSSADVASAEAIETTYITGADFKYSGWIGKDDEEVVIDTVKKDDATAYTGGDIYGKFSEGTDNVSGGKVIINDGKTDYYIYGGYSKDGNATNNTVIMNGGTIGNVYGGYADNHSQKQNPKQNHSHNQKQLFQIWEHLRHFH
jgi:hypothetical protein